ncbi:MAG: FdrA family protein [Streptosporangiales bacterium]|nr:FdrA family protein [Streptosporangiales bacterium]
MRTRVEVRRGEYHDSVTLMSASLALAELSSVAEAQVAMGTELNLELLADRGFDVPAGTAAGDLVVAVRFDDDADPDAAMSTAVERLAELLTARVPATGSGVAVVPHTTAGAVARTGAELAVVSVPGEYAYGEAVDALRAGSNVMVFSDNVPLEQEIALKREAAERGLLVMGPDCGTAVIDAVGFGFANVVEPGPVSLVAASGTGAQQLTCLLAEAGCGVRHVLGVGGRDLSAEVGGLATRQALDALLADNLTELTVVVTKPPDGTVLGQLTELTQAREQAVLWAPVGQAHDDLTAVAERVLRSLGRPVPQWPQWRPVNELTARPGSALRGLFCGGTLCGEAATVAAASLPADRFAMTDFGADEYTRGRAHPMIDPTLRTEEFVRAAGDPSVGAVLADVVLGYGSHPDPAGELAPAVAEAAANVVISLTGSRGDEQNLDRQARTLADAGAHVHLSNAAAARHAVTLVS